MTRRTDKSWISTILGLCKGTILHPQWLSDRYHAHSRRRLSDIPAGTVLDIGSGGSVHKQLMAGGIQLVRLDYPVTNQRYKNRPDIYGDAQKLPVMNASIDAVLLLEVLEHIEFDSAVLSEVNRVLKAGGVLYISVPFIYPQHDVPYDFRRWTQYGLQQVLETNGFVIRELRVHGHSLITAMQLFNLALLEICQELLKWHRVVGLLAVCLCYPLCLLINLLALPLSLIRLPHAASFGFFVIAERAEGH